MAKKVVSINERVLANVPVNAADLTWFQPWLAKWRTDDMGSKPTDAMLQAACKFSTRGAGRESGFVALQTRPDGCTIGQLAAAFSCGPAHNHTRDIADRPKGAGWFTRTKVGAPGDSRCLVFSLTFTPSGEVDLYRRLGLTADGKPVKPVKVARKRNAKAAPAEVVTVDTDTQVHADSMAEGSNIEPELAIMTSDGPQL